LKATRVIISGEPGARWLNDTGVVRYQFLAALRNTCGRCLPYYTRISTWWPIPLHHRCRCVQFPIAPGTLAPFAFVEYRTILAKMDDTDKRSALGTANYRMVAEGLVKLSDIVTPSRIRGPREVAERAGLTEAQLAKAGIELPKPRADGRELLADYEAEHDAALVEDLGSAQLAQDAMLSALDVIAPPPAERQPHRDAALELARIAAEWRPAGGD
jgi:hypothetical protein